MKNRKNKGRKSQLRSYANNWDQSNERLVRRLEEQCNGYKYMYGLMRKRYKKYSEFSTIASGILGAIIATIGLVSTNNKEAMFSIGIVNIVLGFFVSVISILKSIYKSEEIQAVSITACTEYAKLSNKIIKQLLLPIYKRDDCIEFIQHINNELNNCASKFPLIDSAIEAEYKRRFKRNSRYISDSPPSTPSTPQTPSNDFIQLRIIRTDTDDTEPHVQPFRRPVSLSAPPLIKAYSADHINHIGITTQPIHQTKL